jgi:hypothetical protein
MKEEQVRKRIDELLAPRTGIESLSGHEVFNGALSLMTLLYGPKSPQVQDLREKSQLISQRYGGHGLSDNLGLLGEGALQNLRAEIHAGLIGSIQRSVTGELLTDFLQLSRAALNEPGEGAKNVAAVLSAALFEDTLRRIAMDNGLPHIEKLQDVLTELKNNQLLQGTQVGIANSYLNFRNSSLHAQWERVDRESIAIIRRRESKGCFRTLRTRQYSFDSRHLLSRSTIDAASGYGEARADSLRMKLRQFFALAHYRHTNSKRRSDWPPSLLR